GLNRGDVVHAGSNGAVYDDQGYAGSVHGAGYWNERLWIFGIQHDDIALPCNQVFHVADLLLNAVPCIQYDKLDLWVFLRFGLGSLILRYIEGRLLSKLGKANADLLTGQGRPKAANEHKRNQAQHDRTFHQFFPP